MSRVLEIQTTKDISEILASYRVVIIDSYASWCYPCKLLEPKYNELANVYSSENIVFCKCNAEKQIIEVKGLPSIDIYIDGLHRHNILGADIKGLTDYLSKLTGKTPPVQNAPSETKTKPTSKSGYKTYGNL